MNAIYKSSSVIDTHCHLDVSRFDADRGDVLGRAWSSGIVGLVVPAIGPSAWEALLQWPHRDPRVQVALGIHPQLLPDLSPADDQHHLSTLATLLARRTAVAVGECGLDGGSAAAAPFERQLAVLRQHFELALHFDLPVIVHCLRAHPQLQQFLKSAPIPPRGILLHSYSGSKELIPFYLAHGCHFSFAGAVTFLEARKPLQALRAVPLERLMLESDAPDQSPHPFRGQRNEPAYLHHIAASVASTLGLPHEVLLQATTDNARRFFSAFAS
jgi:TatD DNase family protein